MTGILCKASELFLDKQILKESNIHTYIRKQHNGTLIKYIKGEFREESHYSFSDFSVLRVACEFTDSGLVAKRNLDVLKFNNGTTAGGH